VTIAAQPFVLGIADAHGNIMREDPRSRDLDLARPRPADRHRWSWRVGSIAGVPVRVHATFVLLLAWVALSHLDADHELALAVHGMALVACVFAIVVAHEFGHVLAARRFGIPTHDITLYPIGGISRIDQMPERPRQDLAVAAAGPAVNLVLALLIYIVFAACGIAVGDDPLTLRGGFAVELFWINLSLAVFNLLPAFPMDGGRLLRALLALRMPCERATFAAARVARVPAIAMGAVGLLLSPMLAVIALFVWMPAGQEARVAGMKSALFGMSVGDAMIAHVETVERRTPIDVAARGALAGFQRNYPVLDGGSIVGVLTHGDLVRGLAMHRMDLTVGNVMHGRFSIANPREAVVAVLPRIPSDGSSLLVVDHDRLVGMLDPEQLDRVVTAYDARSRA
jgi:Zn-dependent protease